MMGPYEIAEYDIIFRLFTFAPRVTVFIVPLEAVEGQIALGHRRVLREFA